ncbi:MAG: DNA topoisomerase, partial [Candidatus Moranbacteria bacterium]|nr:DNA topoisomerase [Candidatus Moranbacteria bacterium]
PRDKKETEQIIASGKKEDWKVIAVKETQIKRSPRAPFITSTLQQTASSRLGLSPSQTMRIAQQLYEAGLITYMRTDSTTLSSQAQNQIAKVVGEKFAKELYQARKYSRKSKNAQEAHEAIRPTDCLYEDRGITPDQKKLYRLIWQRAVSSQMIDASVLRTRILANITSGSIPDFVINGSRTLSDGWLLADPIAKSEDIQLPKISTGDILSLVSIASQEKETQTPARYSEAGLIKELEKRGIGRPSTYASIIKTIQDRVYVEKISKALHPTDTGDVVSSFLEKEFANYISDSFTAKMENNLDSIAEGEAEYEKTLKDFYTPFSKEIKSKKDTKKITDMGKVDEKFLCPVCKSPMVWKLSKNGKFMSCGKFPKCTGARNEEGEKLEGPKETGEKCPKCEGALVQREGKYGKFISCSNYPKCKFIKEDPEEIAKKKTGIKCPECQKGEMMERNGKFGIFYSCTNYPTCRYAIKAKPTGKKCPLCGKLMMEGTKTIPERCSDKNCPNHRPDRLKK